MNKTKITWDEKGKRWRVDFFIGKVKRVFKEKNYKNAFFWLKYQNEITLAFIRDYKRNN